MSPHFDLSPLLLQGFVLDSTANERAWEIILQGGFFMWCIMACSFVALAIGIHRLLALRWSVVVPPPAVAVVERIDQALQKRAGFQAVRQWFAEEDSPLGRIAQAALSPEHYTPESSTQAVESVAREEMVRLQTGIAALDVIITISPMLGLLGTVSGLVTVFGTLGASQDLSDPSVIAAGIAEALYTTIAGLAVAIVAVIVHRYLDKRIESLSVRLEILVGQLITAWHRWGGPAAVNGPLPEMGPGDHWDPQEASGAPDSPAA